MIPFERTRQQTIPNSAVKIIGVGGAGANMLDRIALDGMDGAELLAVNTDVRTLASSVAAEKIQLGRNLTKGLGTGGDPALGRQAAAEAELEIRDALRERKIVFICVGLGGGTGSGAAPLLARLAREQGAFTVVFATMPFAFEGQRRKKQAEDALTEISAISNALVTFDNTRMGELVLAKQGVHEAFGAADRMVSESIKAVTRIVLRPGLVNIGLDDLVSALSSNKSRCLFGSGIAEGENRAQKALKNALVSPLLDRGSLLNDATAVLVHICGGEDLTLYEIELLMRGLSKHVPDTAQLLFGTAVDPAMGESLSVTLVSSLPEDKLLDTVSQDREMAPPPRADDSLESAGTQARRDAAQAPTAPDPEPAEPEAAAEAQAAPVTPRAIEAPPATAKTPVSAPREPVNAPVSRAAAAPAAKPVPMKRPEPVRREEPVAKAAPAPQKAAAPKELKPRLKPVPPAPAKEMQVKETAPATTKATPGKESKAKAAEGGPLRVKVKGAAGPPVKAKGTPPPQEKAKVTAPPQEKTKVTAPRQEKAKEPAPSQEKGKEIAPPPEKAREVAVPSAKIATAGGPVALKVGPDPVDPPPPSRPPSPEVAAKLNPAAGKGVDLGDLEDLDAPAKSDSGDGVALEGDKPDMRTRRVKLPPKREGSQIREVQDVHEGAAPPRPGVTKVASLPPVPAPAPESTVDEWDDVDASPVTRARPGKSAPAPAADEDATVVAFETIEPGTGEMPGRQTSVEELQAAADFDPKKQTELLLEGGPKGRFEGEEPNMIDGEDLDVPPFLRRQK